MPSCMYHLDVMTTHQPSGSLYNWTQLIYALHAFSLLTGIVGTATIVGAFLTGWPSIIASSAGYRNARPASATPHPSQWPR